MNKSLEYSEFDNDPKSFFLLGSQIASPMVTRDVKKLSQRDILNGIFSNPGNQDKSFFAKN